MDDAGGILLGRRSVRGRKFEPSEFITKQCGGSDFAHHCFADSLLYGHPSHNNQPEDLMDSAIHFQAP